MRIQFINAVLGGDYSAMDIGITYLASWLNLSSQHQAGITDLVFHRRDWQDKIMKDMERYQPDWVGVSLNTMYLPYARKVIAFVKQKYPEVGVIVGGHHASLYPEQVIGFPEVDAVCIGDGEYALSLFLDAAQKSHFDAAGISGIWYKSPSGIIQNANGRFIDEITTFSFLDYDLWEDLDKYFYYLGMLYIQGSRGCPYHCRFCDAWDIGQAVEGHIFRLMDPRRYAREVARQAVLYKHRGLRLMQLFDPVFTINSEWVEAFCDEYIQQGAPLPFSVFARIDHLDEQRIKRLAQARCALLRVGIEAGEEKIRNDVYKKNIFDQEIRDIFKLCRRYGIGLTAFYIIGGPSETPATVKSTIDMAVELDSEKVRSAFFIYKPFTKEAAALVTEHGGQIDPERWSGADNITFNAVISSPSLSPRQAEWLQKEAYFRTFGCRLIRMIKRKKQRYFLELATYLIKGLRHGLSIKYLVPYYHIYGYDNVER